MMVCYVVSTLVDRLLALHHQGAWMATSLCLPHLEGIALTLRSTAMHPKDACAVGAPTTLYVPSVG